MELRVGCTICGGADHVPVECPEFEKKRALFALSHRRANAPVKIDNASLYAGEPMYFYCEACGANHATLPEDYLTPPPKLCAECAEMKAKGWL